MTGHGILLQQRKAVASLWPGHERRRLVNQMVLWNEELEVGRGDLWRQLPEESRAEIVELLVGLVVTATLSTATKIKGRDHGSENSSDTPRP